MWITLILLGVIFSIVSIVSIMALGADSSAIDYVGVVFTVLFAVFGLIAGTKTRKNKKIKEQTEYEEKMKRQASFLAEFPHVVGLPIAEKTECLIYSCPTRYEIVATGNQFNVDKDKITDISTKTDVEIQNQISSSVGGAVGGAVLFGPLGAMIGGRAKKREAKTVSTYLIFTYNTGGEVKYIAFDTKGKAKQANLFVQEFQETHSGRVQNVDL